MTIPTSKQNDTAQAEYTRLHAELKQRGHTLGRAWDVHTKQPRYFVSAWGFCKPLPDLDAVRGFLQQVGGKTNADNND